MPTTSTDPEGVVQNAKDVFCEPFRVDVKNRCFPGVFTSLHLRHGEFDSGLRSMTPLGPIKGHSVFLLLFLCGFFFLLFSPSSFSEDASSLMAEVRMNMPRDEVDVTARLRTRNRQGDVRNEQELDFMLRLGQQPAEARYVLRSRFGDFRQAIRIQLNADTGIPEITQQLKEGGPDIPIENPYEDIAETEINWLDVSFGFLWWPHAEFAGEDKKLGRDCVVVDLISPDPASPYAGVRLWIDPTIAAVLEIEAYGPENVRLKRLRVKRLRKRNHKWFLKELEVLNAETYRRTHIILNF